MNFIMYKWKNKMLDTVGSPRIWSSEPFVNSLEVN